MAITSVGYAGTVNDAQWANLTHLLGDDYLAELPASVRPTQVAATRTVRFATGSIFGRGIKDTLGATEDVTPATPTNGQWYLIVARRVWATKVTSLVAIASTTTTTSVPTGGPPASYPAMSTTPGTQDDQPMCWVWINSANTTMLIVDLRIIDLAGRTYNTQADLPAATIVPVDQAFYVKAIAGARFYSNGAAWRMEGVPEFTASAAAITSPAAGMKILIAGITYRHNGSAWRTWESDWITYVPTLTGFAVGTGGSALASVRYKYEGGLIRVDYKFVFGTSGTTFPTFPEFTLPISSAALKHPYEIRHSDVTMYDVSAALNFGGKVAASNASITAVRMYSTQTGAVVNITTTNPFTWAAGDTLAGQFTYEPV